jgi:hypothetical protein
MTINYQDIFARIQADERYQRNLDWGEPRSGHPEGTVRAHIAELEANLEKLREKFCDEDCWKLRILIHTHDSFKAQSKSGVAISDPHSHASLARAFLAEFCDDQDLLAMVRFHDEPYALWRQVQQQGQFEVRRLNGLVGAVSDWNLFLGFLIIDGCTAGKSRQPLVWLFGQLVGRVETEISAADILPIT